MRSLLSSGWTVLALLLTGTYLLGFAGTALAEDYPQVDAANPVSGKTCELVGTTLNPTSCTHYTSLTCTDTINDPNMDGCRPYRWVVYHHHRPYGVCVTHAGTCAEHQRFPCAKLKIWQYLEDCQASNSNWVWAYIYGSNMCQP